MRPKAGSASKRRVLAALLSFAFLSAMVMGTGPGVLLVNPDAHTANSGDRWLGLPVVYAWGLLWYAVMVAVLVAAYCLFWRHDDESDAGP